MSFDTKYTKHITIIAKGRGDDGGTFLRLKVSEQGRSPRTEIMSVDAFTAEPKATIRLLQLLLASAEAHREFERRVQDHLQKEISFHVAIKSGWFHDSFVDPNGSVIGDCDFEVCLPSVFGKYGRKFRDGGTMSGWQKLAKFARGNSRLVLALALAFVGPIGRYLQVEQVMIQLIGKPGSGKSTIATVAGSVWGLNFDLDRPKFYETWNNTINKLDPVGAAHHGTFVVLDETKNVDRSGKKRRFDVIADALMRLQEGAEKGRYTDVGIPNTFWFSLLSTSNLSLDQMALADRCYIDDAHRTRLIDIPPLVEETWGVYENLHGFEDHATFSAELLRLARTHYGVASVAYLRGIIDWRKDSAVEFKAWLEKRRDRYRNIAKKCLVSATRDLARLHEKFATIYVAGALAIELGILPWTRKELLQALLACEEAHINMVARSAATVAGVIPDANSGISRLRDHIRDRHSNFVDLTKGLVRNRRHDHATCEGYINRQERGPREYLFSLSKLLEICGSNAELARVKRTLKCEGILIADANRPSVRRTIWARGLREQVIAVRADAFGS